MTPHQVRARAGDCSWWNVKINVYSLQIADVAKLLIQILSSITCLKDLCSSLRHAVELTFQLVGVSVSEPILVDSMASCLFVYLFISYILLAPGCLHAMRKNKPDQ